MISVEVALALVQDVKPKVAPEILALSNAFKRVLSEPIFAPIHTPPFHQSAMDGYAFNTTNTDPKNPIPLQGISEAGNTQNIELKPGFAQRIFTGAPVPNGANTVIMQEMVSQENNFVRVEPTHFLPNLNIREMGSQLKKGELVLPKFTQLNEGMIGLLAGLGIHEVCVYKQPKIGLLITGKELISAPDDLLFGQIYESNSIMLSAGLSAGNLSFSEIMHVSDTFEESATAIRKLLDSCDIILSTGGISVGDFDYMKQAFDANNIECKFYKVKQRPGKPLYFGCKDQKAIFGLPGNPGSVMSCFYMFVLPLLRNYLQLKPINLTSATLIHAYEKKAGLTHFVKGKYEDGMVQVLGAQESYKLNAFVEANCLVVLDETKSMFNAGENIRIFKFNDAWN